MDGYSVLDEIECLKSSFDASEFSHSTSSNSLLLKFTLQNVSVTFEIPPTYPMIPPVISILTIHLTNHERLKLEHEVRSLADKSIGYPMIMDLVIRLQQLMEDFCREKDVQDEQNSKNRSNDYEALILIDHMRQKKKYCNALSSWACEMKIAGCLLFYQKWIFLLLQGTKKYIKEFIVRLKTVNIDVDSNGKPCKEKMSTVLFEAISSGDFTEFSLKEIASFEEMEKYFAQTNTTNIFNNVIKPIINKNNQTH